MNKIVVDIYGADAGTAPVLDGVAAALGDGMDFFPVLVGDRETIRAAMTAHGVADTQYEVMDTDKSIQNDDPPTCIFGGCDDTSMAMAYTRLKADEDCVALLSAGNTGALLVGSMCRLGLFGGLKYPALGSALPCGKDNLLCLVDCGAGMDCTASDLERFAKMGHVFSQCFCGIENPRVGLMSVGREQGKGNAVTREAFERIRKLPLNFVGNLEGSDMVSGYADVIVADGYAGNILLKNTEAVGKAALAIVETVAADADPALLDRIRTALFKTFDFNAQGAATFLGTKKIVVKMHGCATADTTVASIDQILRLQNASFIPTMAAALGNN